MNDFFHRHVHGDLERCISRTEGVYSPRFGETESCAVLCPVIGKKNWSQGRLLNSLLDKTASHLFLNDSSSSTRKSCFTVTAFAWVRRHIPHVFQMTSHLTVAPSLCLSITKWDYWRSLGEWARITKHQNQAKAAPEPILNWYLWHVGFYNSDFNWGVILVYLYMLLCIHGLTNGLKIEQNYKLCLF